MSELGGVQIEFSRVDRLKCFGYGTVQSHRAGGWQVVVQHLTDDFVRKSVTARRIWHRHQHANGDRFVKMIDHKHRLNSAHCRQDVRVKFTAYHGRQGEVVPGTSH